MGWLLQPDVWADFSAQASGWIYLITQITSTLLISALQTRDLILAIDGGAFIYSDQKPAALVLLAYG